jgi:hypothetical protein
VCLVSWFCKKGHGESFGAVLSLDWFDLHSTIHNGSHLYVMKESYQRVGEEMHSMKVVN